MKVQQFDEGFVKLWEPDGLPFEKEAIEQLHNCVKLPFVRPYVAAMPDCHAGWGSTVGSVIPMKGAVVPSAVGVDIGCGMMAWDTGLKRDTGYFNDLPALRTAIEAAVPNGRTDNGGENDRGAWHDVKPEIQEYWSVAFEDTYEELCTKYPGMRARNTVRHIGTLGTGNHFIELATDERGIVWVVLHSGSRGLGNKIGSFFSELALKMCEKWFINLPHSDLAYLPFDTEEAQDYIIAVELAQDFARYNREVMMKAVASKVLFRVPMKENVIQCHHNYLAWENHFKQNMIIVRKGAVRARSGDMGIIPGSMGAKSFIVKGRGNPDSFCSCSHGAGRVMSRTKAKQVFTVADHAKATEGVECYKGDEVLDETPGEYKDIDNVMAAQSDLVEIGHTLKQFVCVNGRS